MSVPTWLRQGRSPDGTNSDLFNGVNLRPIKIAPKVR